MSQFSDDCPICNSDDTGVCWIGPRYRISQNESYKLGDDKLLDGLVPPFKMETITNTLTCHQWCNSCGYKWSEECPAN